MFVAILYTKPKSELKWEIDLNLQNFNWRLPNNILFKIANDIKLRWFQYRIIHRILSTNTYLYKIGIANNSNCTFCTEENETLLHIFGQCRFVQSLWDNILTWINDTLDINVELTLSEKILGKTGRSNIVINLIITLIKYYIYKTENE